MADTHFAFLNVELVEYCIAVEPVIHHKVSNVELSGSEAQEAALQPFRKLACGANIVS
jgi:hypothetical protein